MYPFSRIIFPVDFSKRCEMVVPAVRAMAGKCNASLTLLHALDLLPGVYAEWYSYAAMVDTTAIKEHSRRSLERFAERLFTGMQVELVVREGRPAEAIAELTKESGADLVMLPTHGHGKFRSLLLGSVTSAVLHDVTVPVWTAAHAAEEPSNVTTFRNVVCAVDMQPASVRVLALASQIAKDHGARLHVVHSEPAVEDLVHSDGAARFRRFLLFRAREEFAPLAKEAGVSADVEIVEGPVGESVAAAATFHHADLLVIGRGVMQGVLGRLRTHSTDIIHRSPCAVLSV